MILLRNTGSSLFHGTKTLFLFAFIVIFQENTTVFSSDELNKESSAANGDLAAAAAAAQMEVDEEEGPEAKKIKIEDDHKE